MPAEQAINHTASRNRPGNKLRPRVGAGAHLLRALLVLAEGHARLVDHVERDWASATFSGTRHTVRLAFAGDDGVAAAERLIVLLPDNEFAIPGQIVADAAIVAVDQRTLPAPALDLTCEVLLLTDG